MRKHFQGKSCEPIPVIDWGVACETRGGLARQTLYILMARRGDFEADQELSKICTELWKLDENRLKPGVDYQINLQGGKDYTMVIQLARSAQVPGN